MADGRLAPGRFADPTAEPLLREDERALVERVRDESPPPGWVPRLDYEMVRGSGEVVTSTLSRRKSPCTRVVSPSGGSVAVSRATRSS